MNRPKQVAEFVHCTKGVSNTVNVINSSIYNKKPIGWFSSWKHILLELIHQKILILRNEELHCNLAILYFHTVGKSCEIQSKSVSWLWFIKYFDLHLLPEKFLKELWFKRSTLFMYFPCFDGSAFPYSGAFLLPLLYIHFLGFTFSSLCLL